MSHAMGRLMHFDPRSKLYGVRQRLTKKQLLKPRTIEWEDYLYLDQGDVPMCVGCGVTGEAAAAPVVVPGLTLAWAKQIWLRSRALAHVPANVEGSTVLGGMKALREAKLIGAWHFAFAWDEFLGALSWLGPITIGVSWLDGMMRPDRNGVIRATGEEVGGHCVLVIGYDLTTGMVTLRQSWGVRHGLGGNVFMAGSELKSLLRQGGEAAIPLFRRQPALKASIR